MKVIIGIDVGTSGVKVLACDEKCRVTASVTCEYPIFYPAPGWTEQNPEDWYSASADGLRQLKEKIGDAEIAGIGLSGQMHGMVALDKDSNVVRPAILWNDQRTASQCREILETAGGIAGLTGYTSNNMLTGFTAGKILWMKENEPQNYEKTVRIINPKDYILYRLTGKISTDVSDASGTGLFDVTNCRFSDELIEKIGLKTSFFAEPLRSGQIAGYISDKAASETFVPAGTPVTAGGGDAVLSTIAMGVGTGNEVGVMVGTSGVVSLHSDSAVDNSDGSVQLSRACLGDKFHIMGVTLAAAGSYGWFAETFGGTFRENDALAEKSEIGAGGVMFLPYINGERCPVNDAEIRGSFTGISASSTRGDFARAVLEGVAMSLRQVYEKIDPGNKAERIILAGGGSKGNLWRQIFSDVFAKPVVTLNGAGEGSGFGAAIVAGIGLSFYPSEEYVSDSLSVKTVNEPVPENVVRYRELYKKYLKIYPALKSI